MTGYSAVEVDEEDVRLESVTSTGSLLERSNTTSVRAPATNNHFTLKSTGNTENILLLWGCRPADGVKAATEMISDVIEVLSSKINPSTLSIQLPHDLAYLIGEDSKFEMVCSNTIQPVLLEY